MVIGAVNRGKGQSKSNGKSDKGKGQPKRKSKGQGKSQEPKQDRKCFVPGHFLPKTANIALEQ